MQSLNIRILGWLVEFLEVMDYPADYPGEGLAQDEECGGGRLREGTWLWIAYHKS